MYPEPFIHLFLPSVISSFIYLFFLAFLILSTSSLFASSLRFFVALTECNEIDHWVILSSFLPSVNSSIFVFFLSSLSHSFIIPSISQFINLCFFLSSSSFLLSPSLGWFTDDEWWTCLSSPCLSFSSISSFIHQCIHCFSIDSFTFLALILYLLSFLTSFLQSGWFTDDERCACSPSLCVSESLTHSFLHSFIHWFFHQSSFLFPNLSPSLSLALMICKDESCACSSSLWNFLRQLGPSILPSSIQSLLLSFVCCFLLSYLLFSSPDDLQMMSDAPAHRLFLITSIDCEDGDRWLNHSIFPSFLLVPSLPFFPARMIHRWWVMRLLIISLLFFVIHFFVHSSMHSLLLHRLIHLSCFDSFPSFLLRLLFSSLLFSSPDDLQMMSDAPAHHLFVLLGPQSQYQQPSSSPSSPSSSAFLPIRLPDILCVVQVSLPDQKNCNVK